MQKIAGRWKCLCFRRCPNERFALITMLIAQGAGQNLGHAYKPCLFPKEILQDYFSYLKKTLVVHYNRENQKRT